MTKTELLKDMLGPRKIDVICMETNAGSYSGFDFLPNATQRTLIKDGKLVKSTHYGLDAPHSVEDFLRGLVGKSEEEIHQAFFGLGIEEGSIN